MLWTKRAWGALLSSEQSAKPIRLHCQHGWTLSLRGNTPLHVSEVVYSSSREKSHSLCGHFQPVIWVSGLNAEEKMNWAPAFSLLWFLTTKSM